MAVRELVVLLDDAEECSILTRHPLYAAVPREALSSRLDTKKTARLAICARICTGVLTGVALGRTSYRHREW